MVTFKTCKSSYVRNKYNSMSDRFTLDDEQIKEVLSYKDISEDFTYCDWYGGTTPITATIVSVEQDKFGNLLFNIKTSRKIPEHYVPSPYDILNGKGLLMPTSYQRI